MFTFTCPRCGALLRISRRNPNDVYECEYCNALLSGVNAVLDGADGAVSQSGKEASAAKRRTSHESAENKTAGQKEYKHKKKMNGGSGLLIAVSALFIIAVLSWLFSGRGEVIKSGDADMEPVVIIPEPEPEPEPVAEPVPVAEPIPEDEAEEETAVVDDTGDDEEDINEPEVYVQDVYLTELQYIKRGLVQIEDGIVKKTGTGEEYSHLIYPKGPYEEIYYQLNGDYSNLSAIWAIDPHRGYMDTLNGVEIYTDGKLAYSAPLLACCDLPVHFDVDISGCNILSILFTCGRGAAVLGDVFLSNPEKKAANPPSPIPEVLPCWLTDMSSVFADGVNVHDVDFSKSSTGDVMIHYLTGRKDSSIEYCLSGRYSSISGFWAVEYRNRETSDYSSFMIFADGQLVYTSPSITGGDPPQYFDKISINNADKLKFVFPEGDWKAGVSNIRLYP